MRHTIFVIPSLLVNVPNNEADEFFSPMEPKYRLAMIEGSAIALVTLEHLGSLQPLIVLTNASQHNELIEGLRNSICRMGANLDEELVKAREKFNRLTDNQRVALMSFFRVNGRSK